MSQPFVGEIRMFAGNFAPAGWLFCDGQPLSISENEILFQLIGTTYGGDGESTFMLPDLRGRVPVHQGNGLVLSQNGGAEEVTLTTQQIPSHNHPAIGAAVTADQASAGGALPANSVTITPYLNTAPDSAFNASAIGPAGGSQPHTNLQPYLCVDFIISLFGIFPSPT
ncbi:microcystin dependent protein MdpB [Janibacter sp. HTCC2649]|uniref:phage tail protein n=1 Tax=Janibacter sp. HTCC2649 TaxID=313589 RepID=UPI000066EB7F|nr:tail fiber protein [Janibacter sp. HTCC2649]EAP99105.1 microcystin dependent protein MdpB [Janibacter sp. HTCC2649]